MNNDGGVDLIITQGLITRRVAYLYQIHSPLSSEIVVLTIALRQRIPLLLPSGKEFICHFHPTKTLSLTSALEQNSRITISLPSDNRFLCHRFLTIIAIWQRIPSLLPVAAAFPIPSVNRSLRDALHFQIACLISCPVFESYLIVSSWYFIRTSIYYTV